MMIVVVSDVKIYIRLKMSKLKILNLLKIPKYHIIQKVGAQFAREMKQ